MAATSGIASAQTRVFLSHAGADSIAAREFAKVLRCNGVEVWFDQDSLQPGDHWMETLERAIQQSSAMVYSAAFSADGTRVVTASADKTARVWDARTGQPYYRHGADAQPRSAPALSEGIDDVAGGHAPGWVARASFTRLSRRSRAAQLQRPRVELLRCGGSLISVLTEGAWRDETARGYWTRLFKEALYGGVSGTVRVRLGRSNGGNPPGASRRRRGSPSFFGNGRAEELW